MGLVPTLKSKRGSEGFTLVEIIVTTFVFSLTVATAMGIFASVIKLQRYNLKQQELLNQTGYVMEYMSRAIRMAQKDTTGGCTGTANKNYGSTGSTWTDIKFLTYNNECWSFFQEEAILKINKNGNVYSLISNNFQITNLQFTVAGDDVNTQPKVTVSMTVQGTGSAEQPQIAIQTTLSQRNLNLNE